MVLELSLPGEPSVGGEEERVGRVEGEGVGGSGGQSEVCVCVCVFVYVCEKKQGNSKGKNSTSCKQDTLQRERVSLFCELKAKYTLPKGKVKSSPLLQHRVYTMMQ